MTAVLLSDQQAGQADKHPGAPTLPVAASTSIPGELGHGNSAEGSKWGEGGLGLEPLFVILSYFKQEIEKGERQQNVAGCSSGWEAPASRVLVPQTSRASQHCSPHSREKHTGHRISKQILEKTWFLEEDLRGHFNQQV